MVFITSPDGSRRVEGDFTDKITAAVIRQMLVSWDTGLPTPSQIHTPELWDQVLDKLDEDDIAALESAVGPWVERVMQLNRGAGPGWVHKVTGVRVEVADKDVPALQASGEFTREEGSDPKNGSTPTGTSSSENLALTGPPEQTTPDSTPPTSS